VLYNRNLKTIPNSPSLTLRYIFCRPHVFTFTVKDSKKFKKKTIINKYKFFISIYYLYNNILLTEILLIQEKLKLHLTKTQHRVNTQM